MDWNQMIDIVNNSVVVLPLVGLTAQMLNTKLHSCHCEEPFDFAQDKLRDVAIYPIEPALARRGLYMLLFPLILHRYFSIITLIGASLPWRDEIRT